MMKSISGAPGPAGIIPIFSAAGLESGVKAWIGTATTDASGNWSVDMTSAGFTQAPRVKVDAIAADSTPGNAPLAYPVSKTATSASGRVMIPNVITILGSLALRAAGAGIEVEVIAYGK